MASNLSDPVFHDELVHLSHSLAKPVFKPKNPTCSAARALSDQQATGRPRSALCIADSSLLLKAAISAKDPSTGQAGRHLAPAKHGPSPVCYAVASRFTDVSPAPPSQRAAQAPSTPGHTVSRRGHGTASAADTVKQTLVPGRSIRLGRTGGPLFAGRMAATQGFGSDTPHSSAEAPARSPRPHSKAPQAQASRQAPPRRQPTATGQRCEDASAQHAAQGLGSWHCCLLYCTSALGCHGGRVGSAASE